MKLSSRFLSLVERHLSSFQAQDKLQHLVVYIAQPRSGEAPTLQAIGEWPHNDQTLPPVEADPDLRVPSPLRRWYPLQEGELLLGAIRAECVPSLSAWPDSLDESLQASAFVLATCISLEIERTNLVEELAQQRQQISMMVHQLRNPLAALRTYAELLLKRLGPENRNRNLVEGLLNEQFQLDRYISGLALVEKNTVQIPERNPSPLLLPPLLPEGENKTFRSLFVPILDRAFATAKLQNRNWEPPSFWPEWTNQNCKSDEYIIAEIMANLIENAFRYSSAEATLGVLFLENGLCIWDEGDEIIESEREKIFRKGYRGYSSKGKPGSGIGLYLGVELARKIGVALELVVPPNLIDSSLPDSGNAFLIRIPPDRLHRG